MFKSLLYAVRLKVIARYLGMLFLVVACLALAPLAVSLVAGEYTISIRYLVVVLFLIAVGLPAIRMTQPNDIQNNESLTITALAFITTPLIMSYPMMASGLNFMDAWFEAVSAVTTTGLSTVANLDEMPKTFLFARAWMQWYGGLGIIIFSVAIVMNHHITLRRLISPEGDNMVTTTGLYARRMIKVYLSLTLVGLFALLLLMDNSFYALTYALAAVSTGGFAPVSNGLAEHNWAIQVTVILLSLSGAIPFILYFRLTRGEWRTLFTDIEVRTLAIIIVLLTAALALTLATSTSMSWQQALHHGVILGISAQTTTGFATLDISLFNNAALWLMIVAMAIGGGVGSTAGGFKVLRLLIVLRVTQFMLQRTSMPPHAVVEPKLAGKALENREIERALLLVILFISTILLSWLCFLAYGYAPLPALFEVTSAMATTGLSTGITSQTLEDPLKFVLCVDMLLGRVELIAILIVLYPGTWLGRRME